MSMSSIPAAPSSYTDPDVVTLELVKSGAGCSLFADGLLLQGPEPDDAFRQLMQVYRTPTAALRIVIASKVERVRPMTDPKPMDPERLAGTRDSIEGGYRPSLAECEHLLADRDRLEAELARERRLGIEAAERVEMACELLGDEHGDIVVLAEAKSEDATYWEEKAHDAIRVALKWRARSDVKAEDVEAAGVSVAQLDAWAHSKGWTRDEDGDWLGEHATWPPRADEVAVTIASHVTFAAASSKQCAFDILAEMAAMEPSADPERLADDEDDR